MPLNLITIIHLPPQNMPFLPSRTSPRDLPMASNTAKAFGHSVASAAAATRTCGRSDWKPWENHGKTMGKPMESLMVMVNLLLVGDPISMEDHRKTHG